MDTKALPGEPHWTIAELPGECANCGKKIAAGSKVLFFPNYRTCLCNEPTCGPKAAQEFEAAC